MYSFKTFKTVNTFSSAETLYLTLSNWFMFSMSVNLKYQAT